MLETKSRNKDYTDCIVRDMAFQVGEHILLNVPPMKDVMSICIKGKHRP